MGKLGSSTPMFPMIATGNYPASVVHVQEFDNVRWHERPDERPKNVFRVLFGTWDGEPRLIATQWMTKGVSAQGKAMPFLRSLLGTEPTADLEIQSLVGIKVQIQVIQKPTRTGRLVNEVVAVMPAPNLDVPPPQLFGELLGLIASAGSGPWISADAPRYPQGPPSGYPQSPGYRPPAPPPGWGNQNSNRPHGWAPPQHVAPFAPNAPQYQGPAVAPPQTQPQRWQQSAPASPAPPAPAPAGPAPTVHAGTPPWAQPTVKTPEAPAAEDDGTDDVPF